MRLRLVVTIVVGSLVTAGAALAAYATDPNDTAGKLDLRRVTGTRTAGIVTVTVRTWDSWQKGVLPQAGSPNRLFVLFDADGDGAAEYRARVVNAGGALVALLTGEGQQFEPVPITRSSGVQIRFSFPTDVLVDADETFAVAARSVYQGGLCSTACLDRAPNTGWIDVPA
jgi:hypothetical protein